MHKEAYLMFTTAVLCRQCWSLFGKALEKLGKTSTFFAHFLKSNIQIRKLHNCLNIGTFRCRNSAYPWFRPSDHSDMYGVSTFFVEIFEQRRSITHTFLTLRNLPWYRIFHSSVVTPSLLKLFFDFSPYSLREEEFVWRKRILCHPLGYIYRIFSLMSQISLRLSFPDYLCLLAAFISLA